MSKTFLIEDARGNFAYIEWRDQNLPYNLLWPAYTVFNCSTGEFIKNKNNRTEDTLPKDSPTARPFGPWDELSASMTIQGFEVVGGAFKVQAGEAVADSQETENVTMKILKGRPAGDFKMTWDPRARFYDVGENLQDKPTALQQARAEAFIREFNGAEGTVTGRTPNPEVPYLDSTQRIHRPGRPQPQVIVHTYTPSSVPPSYQARMDELIKVANKSTMKAKDEDPS